jgi:hypothetical protein
LESDYVADLHHPESYHFMGTAGIHGKRQQGPYVSTVCLVHAKAMRPSVVSGVEALASAHLDEEHGLER